MDATQDLFGAAHREFHLTNQTAQQSGFHSSNTMIEQGHGVAMLRTVDAIAQLTTTMALDRGTVATLPAINAKHASQLEGAQAYIKTPKDDIIDLKANIKPAWQVQNPSKSRNYNYSCWSHGHQVHSDHTSTTCKSRKDGHQETATKDNTMVGVAWGK
jgi:hypothetical protein